MLMLNQISKESPSVCIQKSDYSNLNIAHLLKPLGGMDSIINRGDRVLLKVNLLAATHPNRGVVTHPAVVKAVAAEVLKHGGEPFIGDSPSAQFTKRRLEKIYQTAGLIDVAKQLGVELNYDTSKHKVGIPDGKRLKQTPIGNFVLKADKIIALPKIKTHSLMMMTLATKIMYGAVPGLVKAKYHSRYFTRKGFADMLLDVLSVVTPDLYIMDGVLGMQGDGPLGGDAVNIGVMLAAIDGVAMDLAVCQLLGIEPIGVPTLKRAKVRYMWPYRIHFPLLTPGEAFFKGYQLPSTAGYLLTGKKRPKRSPVPNKNCTGCGDCEQICPRRAIKLINNIARVNYDRCIRCYCCHEVCPDKAISLEILK